MGKLKSAGTIKMGSMSLAKQASMRNSLHNAKLISALLGMPLKPRRVALPGKKPPTQLMHRDEVLALAFSPDGARLYSTGEGASLHVWEPRTGRPLAACRLGTTATTLAVSSSGRYVVVGMIDRRVAMFDAGSNKQIGSFEVESEVLSLALTSHKPFGFEVLAVGTAEKKVLLTSIPSGERIATLKHGGDVRTVSFSPSGSLLAAGGGTDEMHGLMTRKGSEREMKTVVWEVSRQLKKGLVTRQLRTIPSDDIVHATAFAPSGKVIAIGGEASTISVLLIDRHFENIASLPSTAGVRCLSWSPDSRFLASSGENMQVVIWDIMSERVVLQLPKANDWIMSVAFSPGSAWLAFCGFGCCAAQLQAVEFLDGAMEEQKQDEVDAEGVSAMEDQNELLVAASLSLTLPSESCAGDPQLAAPVSQPIVYTGSLPVAQQHAQRFPVNISAGR